MKASQISHPWALVAFMALASVGLACASSPSGDAASGAEPTAVAGATAPAERQVVVTVSQRDAWSLPRAGTSARAYDGADYATSPRTRRLVDAIARSHGLVEVAGWPIPVLGVHCVVFEAPPGVEVAELVDLLAADPRVESAQPMNRFVTEAAFGESPAAAPPEPPAERGPDSSRYDDPYLELQHGFRSMQVTGAHLWAEGRGVEVVVIDTAVDRDHPELAGRIALSRDFVGLVGAGAADYLHGTAVTGIIAAAANNGIGIVGVAPRVDVVALGACWAAPGADGGAAATCNTFTLAKALAFAVERGPEVINLSLTGPDDPLLGRLLGAAVAQGIVVVAATGPGEARAFPASVEGVLAVRASAVHGGLPGNLAAPGVDILTTVPGGGFDFLSGSSFAAAQVSGVVALLLERDRRLDARRVAQLLADSSRDAAGPGAVGAARSVNACAALAALVGGEPCPAG